ncbi:MAG: bifunctional pyr operon transcriptional regulator/uracil phosphoribosyltransferase PyrR [Bacteroidetes bacterium]|nr:bifunctional pyr operon transcriptional regulator/uracil phosphoribosyltransferase PyrR [Bacteroidota bacterium]
MSNKILINSAEINIILHRLACQLIENHPNLENTVIIGLQPRGVYLAQRLITLLKEKFGIETVYYGQLDITFYRDDFRRSEEPLKANQTNIKFIVEDKHVIFIDDVLFSGRSIRAALTAIQSFGRPKSVELMVLIDRRFSRELPIQPDYTGRQVDVINQEKVKIYWKERDEQDAVYITNIS